jgi:hypothetical protein
MPSTLAAFIKAAKQSTYAALGDSASVAPLLPSTKQLEFASGEYLYRDIYAGMNLFVGQELVYELLWRGHRLRIRRGHIGDLQIPAHRLAPGSRTTPAARPSKLELWSAPILLRGCR